MTQNITAPTTATEWETSQGHNTRLAQVDSTHWIMAYRNPGGGTSTRIMELNAGTGALTVYAAATADSVGSNPNVVGVMGDDDRFIVVWRGTDGDGFARTVDVNTSTWAVSYPTTSTEVEVVDLNGYPGLGMLDATHTLIAYRGDAGDGFARTVSLDAGTGALASVDSLEFDTANCATPVLCEINGDATRWLVVYTGDPDDGFARVLTVNNSTWAITATSVLEFDTTEAVNIRITELDPTHFLIAWHRTAGTSFAQVLSVNTSTWAITAEGSPTSLTAGTVNGVALLRSEGGDYIVARSFTNASGLPYVEALVVDGSTWAVTVDSTAFELAAATGGDGSIYRATDNRAIVVWADTSTNDGFAMTIDIETEAPPVVGSIFVGADPITNIYIGDDAITSVYVGDDLAWPR